MNRELQKNLQDIFAQHHEIKLVYLFGSRARGDEGPLSDYDFACYIDEKDNRKLFALKARLLDEISRALKTDKVDIVILNTLDMPEMKYHIITDGKLIFEKEPFKVLIEPRILNEYFDFHSLLKRHHLTKTP